MPVAPQVPNNPEDVDGTFEEEQNTLVYLADSEDLSSIGSNVQAALDDAEAALAQAQVAFDLASGSLQKSANTITNASNQLTAINGNGVTVYAGASQNTGARVVLNAQGITGFNTNSEPTFAINAATGAVSLTGALFAGGTISGGQLNIGGKCTIDQFGVLTARDANITGTITGSTIRGTTIESTSISTDLAITTSGLLRGTFVTVDGILSCEGFADFNGLANFDSSVITNSNLTANGALFTKASAFMEGTLANTSTSAANVRINTNSGLLLQVTSSSERFKQDITPIDDAPAEVNPDALLEVPVRAFKYRPGYVDPHDRRADDFIPGFIAEELEQVYPIAVDYDDDGLPVDWNFRYIVPGLLALIQRQQQQIDTLQERVAALEAVP